jgi:hypothetical protein
MVPESGHELADVMDFMTVVTGTFIEVYEPRAQLAISH